MFSFLLVVLKYGYFSISRMVLGSRVVHLPPPLLVISNYRLLPTLHPPILYTRISV